MVASLCWLAEAVLESSGAFFAFRKKLTLLWLLLGFRALADVLTLFIRLEWGRNAYGVAWWVSLAVQYLLLCWLACHIVRELAAERYKDLMAYAALISMIGSFIAVAAFDRSERLRDNFLDAEIAAGIFLMVLIVVAALTRKAELSGPWTWIAAGWIVSVASNVVCAFLWQFWPVAPKLMPIGALAALITWNLAAWRAPQPETLEEVRLEHVPKFEPSSLKFQRQKREWVM